jgi:pimeloyl-ACP methyl ester carboxylesterase
MDDLVIPAVRKAPRFSRAKLGHFVDDVGYDGFAHFLAAYRAGMAELPPVDELFDVATTFGTVRAYRFGGAGDGPPEHLPGSLRSCPPVVLLPGRNASTPMWRVNLPSLLTHRTVYCIDLLGEAGLSVQERPIAGPDDQAQWLDEALGGLGLDAVHLMGVSVGGWTATNCAVRRPSRVASLTLLDPAMTFARIPVKTMIASGALFAPGVPNALRSRVLRWIAGGAQDADSLPEAALISAGSSDFVLRSPMPKVFTDAQLRSLDIPVLVFLAGRSVMHDARRAAVRARDLLPNGQIELWPEASHAINGEYPDEIAAQSHRFWDG